MFFTLWYHIIKVLLKVVLSDGIRSVPISYQRYEIILYFEILFAVLLDSIKSNQNYW